MATPSSTELKVLISVLQQAGGVKSLVGDAKNLVQALKQVDQTQLNNAVNSLRQLQQATQAAKQTASGVGSGTGGGPNNPNNPANPTNLNAAERAAAALNERMNQLDATVNRVGSGLRLVFGGFLAYGFVRFIKDIADTAARAEVLGTVLRVVAANAGISAEAIDQEDKAIQRLGITAQSSRQALTQLLQANLSLGYAKPLARAAQDLAVISGMNSSQTFQRLILNIQQLDTMGLRWMGIVVNRTQAEKAFAAQNRLTAEALTQRQKQEALTIAVIEKAKELDGVYAAAMGDVGKQISSLERFHIELKNAVGDALLPAYRALIEEYSLFLAQARIMALETNANKDAAVQLGDAVGYVASKLREGALWVLKYRDTFISLIKYYLEFKVVALVVRGLFAIGSFVSAAIATFAQLRLVLTGASVGFAGVAAAAGGFGGALASLGIIGVIGVLYGLYNALKMVKSGFEEVNRVGFREAAKNAINSWGNWLIGINPTQTGQLAAAAKAWSDQLEVALEAQRRYTKALNNGGTQAELEASLANLNTQKEAVEEFEKAFIDQTAQLKATDPARKKAEDAFLERKRLYNEEMEFAKKYQQAMDDLFKGKLAFSDDQASGEQFGKLSGAFDTALQQAVKGPAGFVGPINPRDSANQLKEGLRVLASAVQTPLDLSNLRKSATEYAKLTGDFKGASEAIGVASIKVRDAQRQFTAPLTAAARQAAEDRSQAIIEGAQKDLSIVKDIYAKRQIEDDQAYQRGLLSLDEYYEQRLERTRVTGALELAVQQANIRQLEAKRPTTPSEDRPALDNQIVAARNALSEKARAIEVETATTIAAKDREQLALVNKIADMKAKLADITGDEAAAVDAIVEKYAREAEAFKKNDQARALNDRIRDNEIVNKLLDVRNARIQAQVNLQNTLINIERQRNQIALEGGNITTSEAMRRENALLRREAADMVQQIAAKEEELRVLELASDLNPDRLKAVRAELVSMDGQVKQFIANINTYGKQLERTFRDGLGRAISDSLKDLRKAGEAFQSFAQELKNNIFDTIGQNLAEKATKTIVGATGGEGNSVFDKFFNVLGLGTDDKKGDSAGNPLYVKEVNPQVFTEQTTRFFDGNPVPSESPFGGLIRGIAGLFGGGGGSRIIPNSPGFEYFASGGLIKGPGTGTSDSIIARVSNGEHIMPADRTQMFLPILEAMRLGRFAGGGVVQSIARQGLIPRYAAGGVVSTDAGAGMAISNHTKAVSLNVSAELMNLRLGDFIDRYVMSEMGKR